jgi:GAF domain-containing protein
MRRNSRASNKPSRSRRPKSSKSKSHKPAEAGSNRPSRTDAETEVAELRHELREARDQQTATSEVLRVISSSAGDLQPLFETMLEKAVRICGAKFGNLWLRERDFLRIGATYGAPPAWSEFLRREPVVPVDTRLGLRRVIVTKQPYRIADVAAEPTYGDKVRIATIELAHARSLIGVPLLRDDEVIGIIVIYRQEVRLFTDKQIELVKNFAAQAVIAIENARLLNELRQSLEQQTATSEVLQVISSSPGDLQPVFESLLRKATQLCKAKFGTLYLREEAGVRLVAAYDMPAKFYEVQSRAATEPAPGGPLDGALKTKRAMQIPDVAATEPYRQRHPRTVDAVELGHIRTAVAVPMLKDDEPIGVISIHRPEVALFDEKQIALLTNFAAQAVIAIENARLLGELRQRTDDLTEALDQQTATSEVLQVISSSPGELGAVFEAMLENAVRICRASFGTLLLYEGDRLRRVARMAAQNVPQSYAPDQETPPHFIAPFDGAPSLGRLVETKALVHIADIAAEHPDDLIYKVAAARTVLIVPMLKESELVGAFAVYRKEVQEFSDKQVELLENFAAQAVIAIENARLLKELRERTDEVENLNQQLEQRVSDQVGEIERMGRLRRFLPPQVADLIVASGTEKQLESHRREITALFCDLRGFTGFTEIADAEDVMALLREYHAAIGKIIIKYSGTLERYAGDGVMVIFNDPVPVENPALQAVLMALEMRDAIGVLTAKWRRLGHDIGFGIGIAHGFATLGTIGFEGRFDYAAIGTVSNVASRLCDEAKPGQILISPRVLIAVENAVTVEPVGEFALKGIRRPLAAYNVLGAVAASPEA